MVASLLHSLALLRALQAERAAALAEGSPHAAWPPLSFEDRERETHAALTAAQKEEPAFFSLLPERFFTAYALRNNKDFRASQPREALMDWYAFNLEQPVSTLALGQLANNDGFTPAQTSALIHYIASLSFLGHLRDRGLLALLDAEVPAGKAQLLRNLALSCASRERLFLGLADEQLRQWMDETKAPSLTAVGQIDQTLRRIKDGYAKGVLAQTTVTDWINALNEEAAGRYDALTKTLQRLETRMRESAPVAAAAVSLESDVESQWNGIKALPLFRGVSDTALRNILKGAKLMTAERGACLFSQGDPLSRFFILLDGWARTTKASKEGQECILQILGRKDCALDQGLAAGMVAPFTLRAVTKCRTLALSLPVLLDHLSRNRELAQNLLTSALARLQRLSAQYEQVTLRDARARVGWFLVNLYLETGLEGEPLQLPFDKGLIAAYLNIKPETFSRVLADFRGQGFVIEKNRVILPRADALCAYCDPEMALRCCRAEAAKCAPIQIARRSGSAAKG